MIKLPQDCETHDCMRIARFVAVVRIDGSEWVARFCAPCATQFVILRAVMRYFGAD